MEIVIPVITLVLGAALGAWYTVYLKRPKLWVTGSGGGGGGGGPGPGHHRNRVTISNRPGLLGIRLNETVILGRQIHKPIEKGLTVDRSPANECLASLYDKESGEHVAGLWWHTREDPTAPYERVVTILSGESCDLMLFARLDSEPTRYFVFAPGDESGSSLAIPNDEAKFTDTHQFVVRINYSYGRQKLGFDLTMRKGFDGRLTYETKNSSGSF